MARIEALAARIEEARGLRREAGEEAEVIFNLAIDLALNNMVEHGCKESTVAEYEELITSGPRNFSSHYSGTGIRFYRAQDIAANGRITDDNVVWVEPPEGMSTRAFVKEGDILIVITGATIGRSAVIRKEHPSGLVSQHVGLVRINQTEIEPEYLHYAILAPTWAGGQINTARYGQGKPGLNLNNLRELRFPHPPLDEQRRIVGYLDELQAKVDALKRLQAEAGAELSI